MTFSTYHNIATRQHGTGPATGAAAAVRCVNKVERVTDIALHISSFLNRGARRAWGPACALIITFFMLAATALAVPPGTVIDNTAQVTYRSWGVDISDTSNTASLTTEWRRTDATLELLQYAPTVGGAPMVSCAMTSFDDDGIAGGSSQQIAAIYPAGSTTPIDLAQPLPLIDAALYHQGEPIFFRVGDADQNMDSTVSETVWIQVSVTDGSDSELLILTETGPDSGVFVGYIQSSGLTTAQAYNGLLDVGAGTQIEAAYTDIADASDTVAMAALVDPFGLVFDSATGQPVDDVQLTLVDDASGDPATVYGDDGVSTFPATITSGGTVTDSGGRVYTFESGHYRFPFVVPGAYRIVATPPPGYAAPSTVPTADLQALPGAPFVIAEPGSRAEAFVINPGPAIQIDIPVDPTAVGLWLQKSANRDVAAIGDFVQYTVTVENNSGALASAVQINDRLPMGFRYRDGSARLNGLETADAQVAANGRNLTFAIGDLADGESAEIRYVTEIAAGARTGRAVNRATAASGSLRSNVATVAIEVKEDLFRSNNFIAGRVIADNCEERDDVETDGVEGVRIYLEDGTYVITDSQGRYHFEGIASGTHVVQLDLDSLSEIYEIAACEDNSRLAGTPFSRFVELHGGTLWRADFHVQAKTPPSGHTELKLSCGLAEETVNYRARIGVNTVAVDDVRLSVVLPEGSVYEAGSSSLDGRPIADPRILGNALVYTIGDVAPGHQDELQFSVQLGNAQIPGQLHTKALLTFNTPGQKNQRTQVVDTILALSERKIRTVQPPIVVRPQFEVLSAQLTAQDRRMLDELAAKLKELEIEHVVITGHTDNRKIRSSSRHVYPNNAALSVIRADNVADYLANKLGLGDSQMTVVGKGAKEPMAENSTKQGRALNRRVEVKIMSVRVDIFHDYQTIKCEDRAKVETYGSIHTVNVTPTAVEEEIHDASFDTDPVDIESLRPGFAMLRPSPSVHPSIPSINLAVQHGPKDQIEMLLNGEPVSAFNFDGRKKNKARTVTVSFWRGVDIVEGDNQIEVICKDANGKFMDRIRHSVHYATAPVTIELLKDQSRLIANGKAVPEIAIRLLDKDGYPARYGIFGEYLVQTPYQAYVEGGETDALNRVENEKPRYQVGRNGIARIKLAPTTQSGRAVVTLLLADKEHDIEVWLQPELREWILVGLAHGTAGYNTVSGNMENLGAADQEEDYYQDGRVAFFAKGKVKGQWLLTAAYDSGRERDERAGQLFQTIDPDTYYTLYGDATEQQYEASSIRKLFLKIERQQFYALFGDYDTGMTVTELSRYSRKFNGLKSEYYGERFNMNVFASDTDQAFVKDEIRGDGTSGLYRLSRKNILINSETVTIETRDRFHSEVILSSTPMARHIDYNIDYDAGTLFFKAPVFSRDENFNPIYIVVDYESNDGSDQAYTYGGRGSVKMAAGRLEVGASYVHEGPTNAEADLGGLDARVDLGRGMQIKAEVAATRKDQTSDDSTGRGLLAEFSKQGAELDAKVYYREQEEEFGIGQQNGSENGTRKIGADAAWRMTDQWTLSGEAFRNYNLATDAQRDVGESRMIYNTPNYSLNGGLRLAEDRYDTGDSERSTQLLAGASRQLLDNRLGLRLNHEQSIGDNANIDYPTRTIAGADYKITEPVAIFAEHEITQGQDLDSQSSRAGLKATPWTGGQVASSVGQQISENSNRLFSNLGLSQKWRITERWSVDGGMDRTQTMRESESAPFNTNVPSTAGGEEDFTALSMGAGYRAEAWSWTGRFESRYADTQDKLGLISAISGEVRPGLGLAAGLSLFDTENEDGSSAFDGDIRLSLAYRPNHSDWIIYDRLEYIFEDQEDANGRLEARRIVNNLNMNYKPHHRLQMALQYGAKYVFDTIDGESYDGYTDLIGLETRYDLTKKWDVGLHGSVLHSWNAGQIDYRSGVSVGHSLIKNMWLSVGYNFTGFEDQDFSAADFTAAGPFVKFRFKFDQQSVREIVDRFTK